MTEPGREPLADPFTVHRSLLVTVAYEILGSAADAEDVLQDAWLRWSDADQDVVADPKAYAVRIVTRVALNQARSLGRRKETYVGPWLPEPILTGGDVADDVVLADSVSLAMLIVLDKLSPVERAVFLLREVFGYEHTEIAQMLERQPASVRQIAHRARTRVRAERPATQVSPTDVRSAAERFVAAATTGDVQSLLDVVSPDVVLVTDGGGVRKAALRPIVGVEKVLRFLLAVQPDAPTQFRIVDLNGGPAVLAHIDSQLDSTFTFEVVDGLVTRILVQRNPLKLAHLDEVRGLSRGESGA